MQYEIDKKFEVKNEILLTNQPSEDLSLVECYKEETDFDSEALVDKNQSTKNTLDFFNKQAEEFVIKNEFGEDSRLNNWSERVNSINSKEQDQFFPCKYCRKSLSTKRRLRRHINEIHFQKQRQIKMTDEESSSDSQNNHNSEDALLEISSTKNKIMQTKKRRNKPKVCSEWSDEEIYKLISCIRSTPMLWNVKDQNYRHKIERQSAWKRIAAINFHGKFKEGEISAKWSNMRIQFRSYLSKYHRAKSEKGVHQQIKWKFYEAMDFISTGDDEQNPNTVSNLTYADEESFDPLLERNVTNSPIVLKRRRISQSSSVTATSPSIVHIATDGMKDEVNHFERQQQKNEDAFSAFGKYIAAELRSLPPNSAQRVRFKVARFLLDCIEAENQPANQVYNLED